MKSWFDTLRIGAIAVFLLGIGVFMLVDGFTRGAEWNEFQVGGVKESGRVVQLTESTDYIFKKRHSVVVEWTDAENPRRDTVRVFRKEFRKLTEGASIEILVSGRDRSRVRAASRIKNKPVTIAGVPIDPIAFVGVFMIGTGGFFSYLLLAPVIESLGRKARRRRQEQRGRKTDLRPLRVHDDPYAGLGSGAALLELARHGRWKELSERLATSDKSLTRTIDDVTEIDGFPEWLDEWAAAEPKASLPWLIRGMMGVRWAWDARTSSRAEEVEDSAWATFYQRLETAETDLARAAALDPTDARPLIRMLAVAKGLSMPLPERLALLEEATRRAPDSFDAHMSYLDAISEKWGGSHQAALAHARRIAVEAPPASGLASLLADVHFEIARSGDSFDEYFESPEVIADLQGVAEACQSIRTPWLKRRASASLAFCFWQAGLLDAAKEQFGRSEGYVCGLWTSYDEPVPLYERAWRECA